MKRQAVIAAALMLAAVLLSGCRGKIYDDDGIIKKAREVIPISDADTIEMQIGGKIGIDDSELVWVISGSEQQSHYYLPMVFREQPDGYRCRCSYEYVHSYKPAERCVDIAAVQWNGGYSFLVNNKLCRAVRITDANGTREYPVTEIPCVIYYGDSLDFEYNYIDIDGGEMIT